jgi:hypothetical protein
VTSVSRGVDTLSRVRWSRQAACRRDSQADGVVGRQEVHKLCTVLKQNCTLQVRRPTPARALLGGR